MIRLRKRFAVLTATLFTIGIGAGAPAAELSAATDWVGKKVPVEVLAQFPMIAAPSMSPDGKWIATRVRVGGVQMLTLVPVSPTYGKTEIIAKTGEATSDKGGDRQIVGYRWADSDHLVITFSTREFFYDRWIDNVRYAAFNRTTKKIIPLGWDEALGSTQSLWISSSGKPHMLLQRLHKQAGTVGTADADSFENPEVVDIDLDTGALKVAMPKNVVIQDWDADSDGVVRLGTGYDRDTGKIQVYYRASAGEAVKKVFDGKSDRYGDLAVPAMITAGSTKAYAYSRGEGYRALYEFDLATMKIGKKVFGVPGYDIDGAFLTPDRKALGGVAYTTGRTQNEYFDPRLKDIQEILEETFGKGNVLIATTDALRETILFRVAKLGQAESWYIFDTKSGGMGRFAYANDALKNAMLNPVSVVSYTASDGKKIEAILTMPRHRAGEKNLPLIVLPHGGPWVRDDADWDAIGWAQSLAEAGYVVIQPNYRGSAGYGRDWEKASEGAWGYRMQDDLNDAIPWLAGQGIADPKRVCMFGWSYGGYAASRAAQRDGSKYRCAISGAGVHDLVAMQKYDKTYLGEYGAKIGMGSASANLIDASPGLHPEQYSIPILIVQGAKDVRVPPAQSRDLVARLKKAGKVEGKDFVYLEQPLNTHHLQREADRVQLMQEMLKFLAKHNPA